MKYFFIALFLFFWVNSAYALTIEESTFEKSFTLDDENFEKTYTITDYIDDYVDVPEGGTRWEIFGTTKEIQIETKTEDGYDAFYMKPEFQPDVTAMNGKQIKIRGYMFPLDGEEAQKTFLFGPFPLSCPFQYHVGPALVIEVNADQHPVLFNYDPITIEGTLELVPEDPEYSVFYRLKNSRQVK